MQPVPVIYDVAIGVLRGGGHNRLLVWRINRLVLNKLKLKKCGDSK